MPSHRGMCRLFLTSGHLECSQILQVRVDRLDGRSNQGAAQAWRGVQQRAAFEEDGGQVGPEGRCCVSPLRCQRVHDERRVVDYGWSARRASPLAKTRPLKPRLSGSGLSRAAYFCYSINYRMRGHFSPVWRQAYDSNAAFISDCNANLYGY